MLLLRKEIMVDAGKMLELEARCPGDRRYPRGDQAVQGKEGRRGGARTTTKGTKVRLSVVEEGDGLQHAVSGFEATPTRDVRHTHILRLTI
jgi:hypothetical protein